MKIRAAARWVLAFAAVAAVAGARPWQWEMTPTAASDAALARLLADVTGAPLGDRAGIEVKDLVFEQEDFRLVLESGVLAVEPDVQGVPGGAWFVGKARLTFTPQGRRAQLALETLWGKRTMEDVEVKQVYLRQFGRNVIADSVRNADVPFVPVPERAAYEDAKAALRQQGLDPAHVALNREGRSRDAFEAVMAVDAIRKAGSEDAWMRYAYDPAERFGVSMQVFGHARFSDDPVWKYFWRPLSEEKSQRQRFEPEALVTEYAVKMHVKPKEEGVEQEATLDLVPAAGTRSLLLDFTLGLAIDSVTDERGRPVAFVQWKDMGRARADSAVLVALPEDVTSGSHLKLTFKSKGSLFTSWFGWFYMKEEDNWIPKVRESPPSIYDLEATVPKAFTVVGAGALVGQSENGDDRTFHYRTPRPAAISSFHFGELTPAKDQADQTAIEAYANDASLRESKNREMTATEVANAVKIYDRIFQPLEFPVLRVVGTPTSHGRGFQGIILIGGGFSDSSYIDVYRAHEVAHQWWGNVVIPEDWRENRWLGESFAEYSSMEFYQVRYGDRKKTIELIDATWMKPLLDPVPAKFKTLQGEEMRWQCGDCYPIARGGQNVYTKGPLVLQMLRHYIKVRLGSDAAFWDILHALLQERAYQTVNTAQFIELVERKLGTSLDWFWEQWLYRGETPIVHWKWSAAKQGNATVFTLDARQESTDFRLYIPVLLTLENGQQGEVELEMKGKTATLSVPLPLAPKKVELNAGRECLVKLVQD